MGYKFIFAAACLLIAISSHTANAAVLGLWELDESSGSTGSDSSGNNHDLNFFNGVTLGHTGQSNTSAYFSGPSYAYNNEFGTFSPSSSTLSLWFNPDGASGVQTLIGSMGIGDANGCCWRWRLQLVNDVVRYELWDGNTSTITSNNLFSANDWNHIAISYSEGGVDKMWLNGIKQTEESAIGTVGAWGYLQLGATLFQGSPTEQFAGYMDKVEIYDTAFTDEMVASLYSGGMNVPVPAAVWLFGSGLLGLVGVARRKTA